MRHPRAHVVSRVLSMSLLNSDKSGGKAYRVGEGGQPGQLGNSPPPLPSQSFHHPAANTGLPLRREIFHPQPMSAPATDVIIHDNEADLACGWWVAVFLACRILGASDATTPPE